MNLLQEAKGSNGAKGLAGDQAGPGKEEIEIYIINPNDDNEVDNVKASTGSISSAAEQKRKSKCR